MNNAICIKCKSTEIHLVGNLSVESEIKLDRMQTAELSYFVCTDCGFVECFVKNKRDLSLIAKKYPKVSL